MFKLHPVFIFAYVALPLICGAWFVSSQARADSSVYTVRDVAVDASAASAAEARSVALADGYLRAFEYLLRRLVLVEDQALLPELKSPKVAALVEGFVIKKEILSPTRYRANLTLDFNKLAVRNLLRQRRIRFAETRSNDILVLPVFDTGGAPTLWVEPGDWRSAWLARPVHEGLVSIALPLGDVIDMAAIDASEALRPARDSLLEFASRYGTEEIVVASASLLLPEVPSPPQFIIAPDVAENSPTEFVGQNFSESRRVRGQLEGAILELVVHRVGIADKRTSKEILRGRSGESMEDFLARAVGRVMAQVEGAWKQANILRFGRENRLNIMVPLKSLSDWIDIRRRLKQLAVLVRVDLVALSRGQADIALSYLGKTEQLILGLEQSDLKLIFEPRGWVLQTSSAYRQNSSSGKDL